LAREIASRYDVFECDKCAKAIAQKLGRDFPASFERLRTSDEGEIIGLVATGIQISKNRVHVGIRIGGLIFDNLHHDRVIVEEWRDCFVSENEAPLNWETRSINEFFGKIFLAEKFNGWLFGS